MEQAIQSYLADDRQYQDRITAALSQLKRKVQSTKLFANSVLSWGSGKKL